MFRVFFFAVLVSSAVTQAQAQTKPLYDGMAVDQKDFGPIAVADSPLNSVAADGQVKVPPDTLRQLIDLINKTPELRNQLNAGEQVECTDVTGCFSFCVMYPNVTIKTEVISRTCLKYNPIKNCHEFITYDEKRDYPVREIVPKTFNVQLTLPVDQVQDLINSEDCAVVVDQPITDTNEARLTRTVSVPLKESAKANNVFTASTSKPASFSLSELKTGAGTLLRVTADSDRQEKIVRIKFKPKIVKEVDNTQLRRFSDLANSRLANTVLLDKSNNSSRRDTHGVYELKLKKPIAISRNSAGSTITVAIHDADHIPWSLQGDLTLETGNGNLIRVANYQIPFVKL